MEFVKLNKELVDANIHKPYELRMKLAVEYWFNEQGMIKSSDVAKLFSVNHKEFTLAVQYQISYKSGVHIVNEAPKVDILNSKEELDRWFPRQDYGAVPFRLDFFDFIYKNKYSEMKAKASKPFSKKDLELIS
jgi:hypothetical protein